MKTVILLILSLTAIALYLRQSDFDFMRHFATEEAEGSGPRTWTAKDGRTIEADFLSTAKDTVTVRRTSDGRTVTIPFSMLSTKDIDWVNRQPKPVEITQDQINQLVTAFPRPPGLSSGEVTNDLKHLHDKYLSMVKFIRPNTVGPSLAIIRNKINDDVKILGEIAKTSMGDHTGRRGTGHSQSAENGVVSAQRSIGWLQDTLTSYLESFETLGTEQ